MTMPTAPYNGTASVTQIINQPLSTTVGPHWVHTEPPPPPRKPHHKTYAHARRPNADAARRGAYKTLKKAGMLPETGADDITKSQTSQGAPLQRSFLGAVYDYTLGVLENALAEEETKTETAKPDRKQGPAKSKVRAATGRSVDRPSMESLMKRIEGKFTCTRRGQPCVAGPGEPLPRVVIIGWEHTGASEEWGEELIAHLKRPGDKVVVEASPTVLEDEKIRNVECLGLSKDDCIAGEIQIVKDALDEAGLETIELEFLMLAVLDPVTARAIWENNYKQPYVVSRLLQEQYEESRVLREPFLSVEQVAEINRLHQMYQELNSKLPEWNGVREENYVRILEREMTRQEGTIFLPIGAGHVENIGRSFSNDDRVIVLMPTRLGEPRRNPRVYD
jgi:hypothetical protein